MLHSERSTRVFNLCTLLAIDIMTRKCLGNVGKEGTKVLLLDAAGNAPVLDDGEAGVGDVELQRHLRHPHRELGLACAWSLSLPGSML